MGTSIAKLIRANKIKTQKPIALIRYGIIMLIVPPATEKANVAIAVPLLLVASGNTSVGYTQLLGGLINSFQDTRIGKLTK